MLGRVPCGWLLAAAGAALLLLLLAAAPSPWSAASSASSAPAPSAPGSCRARSLRRLAAAAPGWPTCRTPPPAPPPAQPPPPPQAPPGAAVLGHIVIAVLLVVSAAGALLEVFRDRIKNKAAPGAEESDESRPGRRCSLADLTVSRHARRESVHLQHQLQLQPAEPAAAAAASARPPLRLPGAGGAARAPLQRRRSFPAQLAVGLQRQSSLGEVGLRAAPGRRPSVDFAEEEPPSPPPDGRRRVARLLRRH